MSIAAFSSLFGARPIRLYDFARGTEHWRYTSADRDVTWNQLAWSHVAISDNGVQQSDGSESDNLQVTLPASTDLAQLYQAYWPSDTITLTVYDIQYGEADAEVVWAGSINARSRPTSNSVAFTCRTLLASFDRPGLTLGWCIGCPYNVFDHNCTVSPALWRVPLTITALDGATITAAAAAGYADGYFTAGFVEWVAGGGTDRRTISSHAGGVLELFEGTDGLTVGMQIDGYPGCDLTRGPNGCAKFNNQANYGGYDLPGKSPYDGTGAF